MWPNPQEIPDLVTFIEEILNGKLHFLCSASFISILYLLVFVLLRCISFQLLLLKTSRKGWNCFSSLECLKKIWGTSFNFIFCHEKEKICWTLHNKYVPALTKGISYGKKMEKSIYFTHYLGIVSKFRF